MVENFTMNLTKQQHSYLNLLNEARDKHSIWRNDLLVACENGNLSKSDLQYLFSQYYYYSKNFTKLIAIALLKNDDDFHRAKLSANLWEESGELDIEKRHAEIFRKFLINSLGIKLDQIEVESYTELFFKEYLELCLHSKPYECFAMLAFGTEGIVSRLYSIFKKGLLNAGFKDEELLFFNLHIECDDDHALTIEEMALSCSNENHWLEGSKAAINAILNLRDKFFKSIYKSLQSRRFNNLIYNISAKTVNHTTINSLQNNVKPINGINSKLYMNKDMKKKINFRVDRIAFNAEVLDPRIVHIPVNSMNELHNHAHETIFLILEGNGMVLIDNEELVIKKGDLVFVPRWYQHQTRNTGEKELKFLAVTDYGFTKILSSNTESVYRQKKDCEIKSALI